MRTSGTPSLRGPLGFAALTATVVFVVGARAATGGGAPTSALAVGPDSAVTGQQSGSGSSSSSDSSSSSSSGSGSSSSSGMSSSSGTRTVTGDAVDTRFGPVQVQLVLSDSRISDVIVLEVPDRERRDIEINNLAVPILREEVLDAQSAQIDVVSGASYTSYGYAQSVQSALDRAGV